MNRDGSGAVIEDVEDVQNTGADTFAGKQAFLAGVVSFGAGCANEKFPGKPWKVLPFLNHFLHQIFLHQLFAFFTPIFSHQLFSRKYSQQNFKIWYTKR